MKPVKKEVALTLDLGEYYVSGKDVVNAVAEIVEKRSYSDMRATRNYIDVDSPWALPGMQSKDGFSSNAWRGVRIEPVALTSRKPGYTHRNVRYSALKIYHHAPSATTREHYRETSIVAIAQAVEEFADDLKTALQSRLRKRS